MKNMLCMGDSVMEGIIQTNGRYHISKNRFTSLLPCDVINKGRFGHTINDLYSILTENTAFFQKEDFSVIMLEYGGNDSDFKWDEICSGSKINGAEKTDINDFRRVYLECIDILNDYKKDIILLTLPPINGRMYYKYLCQSYDKDILQEWLENDMDYLTHRHEAYNHQVMRIASEANVCLIDITSPFLIRRNYSELLCPDGIHPNENGHRLIADTILNKLC